MSELLETSWTGNFNLSDIFNATNWCITKHPVHGACLVNLALEDEGIDNLLPLIDLFQNPVFPLLILNENGKIDSKFLPSLVLGKQYYAANIEKMLSLINPETGLPPEKMSICVTGNLYEASTFLLSGNDPTQKSSWVELRARHILWSEIKNNPLQFPLNESDWETILKHHHNGKYAELDANGNISPSTIPKFTLGKRHKAFSESEMLSLAATSGDICTRFDFDKRKSFLLFGDPSILENWIYLEPPETGVESINFQTGNVFLTPDIIGAAEKEHVHEPPYILKELNGHNVKLKFTTTNEFNIYVDNILVVSLKLGSILDDTGNFIPVNSLATKEFSQETFAEKIHHHDSVKLVNINNNLQFHLENGYLYYSLDGTPGLIPFG